MSNLYSIFGTHIKFMYLGTYMYIHMHICVATVNEKRGHAFERGQGGVYGSAWREEREERKIYSSQKITEIIFKKMKGENWLHKGILWPHMSDMTYVCICVLTHHTWTHYIKNELRLELKIWLIIASLSLDQLTNNMETLLIIKLGLSLGFSPTSFYNLN